MRVVLSTYGGRGDVEPLVGLAVALRTLGARTLICAPGDCAARIAEVGVKHVTTGPPVRPLVQGTAAVDVSRRIAEVMEAQFDTLAPAAEGADAIVATGLFPATAGAQSVAEKLGIRFVYGAYSPHFLPSPRNRPQPLPGRTVPADVTDPERLNEIDIENYNAAFGAVLNRQRAAVGLPPVDNVRDHVITGRPWLAADPVLGPAPSPQVVQTGAWRVPDERPLPDDVEDFLDSGAPPVYVGFGSMRAPAGIVQVAVDAIRAHGHRVLLGRGWSDLDPAGCFAVGEVNQQALFPRVAAVVHHGGAGTTTTSARAGAPQVVVPQMADQPYWAGRVAELGIGVAHDGPVPTAASLAAALDAALTPAVRERAAAVAPAIRADGATDAAKLLSADAARP
jgi:vancomycin aglycone glucosyltransferase